MKLLVFSIALLAAMAPEAGAGDAEFQAIVRGVESNFGIHRLHIPLFGTVLSFATASQPWGVKQVDVAIFEDRRYTLPEAGRFEAIVRQVAGDGWSPVVRVRGNHGRELTYIYTKPAGGDLKIMVANFEPTEAVLTYLKGKPEAMLAALDHPKHASHSLAGDH
jgi:hypothetical protein